MKDDSSASDVSRREPMESTLDELPSSHLSADSLKAMYRGNAERLFPRFKT